MAGSPAEIKEAKKEIKKITCRNGDWCRQYRAKYFEILDNFDQIKDAKHQAAFIDGTGIFFLCLRNEDFEKLSDFTLRTLQSPHGNVREAIRKASDWLHILIVSSDSESEVQVRQYLRYINGLEELMEKYPDKSRAKYIDKMPPSVNKSVQMVWSRIASGRSYSQILDKMAPDWIRNKREEISKSLEHLIIKYNDDSFADMRVDDMRQIILFEQNSKEISKLLKIINPNEKGLAEAVALCNEAWNYFPHNSLNNKCPAEMAQEFTGDNPGFSKNPLAPIWQEIKDEPAAILEWENGVLAMKSGNDIFENKTMIGTPAGGKGNMARFYFIFATAYDMEFSKGMAAHFGAAAKAVAEQYDFELETIEIKENCALVAVFMPFDIPPARFGNGILKFFGKGKNKMLKTHYYTGNTSKPDDKEIKEYLDFLDKEGIE